MAAAAACSVTTAHIALLLFGIGFAKDKPHVHVPCKTETMVWATYWIDRQADWFAELKLLLHFTPCCLSA